MRSTGAVFCLSVLAAALPCLYSAHAALSYNPIHLPLEREARATMWLPQSWKFFTRDPQEARDLFFVRGASGWTPANTGANAEPGHLFGLNRASRAQGVEHALLAPRVPSTRYRDCDDEPAVCLEAAPREMAIDNPSPMPTLCGDVGLVQQKPVPWAWARSGKAITMPSRVVRLRVSC